MFTFASSPKPKAKGKATKGKAKAPAGGYLKKIASSPRGKQALEVGIQAGTIIGTVSAVDTISAVWQGAGYEKEFPSIGPVDGRLIAGGLAAAAAVAKPETNNFLLNLGTGFFTSYLSSKAFDKGLGWGQKWAAKKAGEAPAAAVEGLTVGAIDQAGLLPALALRGTRGGLQRRSNRNERRMARLENRRDHLEEAPTNGERLLAARDGMRSRFDGYTRRREEMVTVPRSAVLPSYRMSMR